MAGHACEGGSALEPSASDSVPREREDAAVSLEPRAALGQALLVGPDASWFCVSGAGPVDLTRRKSLRRLLRCLVRAHADADVTGLSMDELLAAGWPGECVAREAGANRVRVAVTTLRKLGLRDHLHSGGTGYRLTPGLEVRQDPRATPPNV